MADQEVNKTRRNVLTATVVVGGVGAIFAAVPFLKSWKPSAKAKLAGAPVTQDLSLIEPGGRYIASWRGMPVWIVRRTPEMLATLTVQDDRLRDPASEKEEQQPVYAQNPERAIKPEYLVLVGICTHLGCSPLFEGKLEAKPYDAEWKGGFFCPCHSSKFDLSGRVFKNVPAQTNLVVPPYYFVDDHTIVIGVHQQGAA